MSEMALLINEWSSPRPNNDQLIKRAKAAVIVGSLLVMASCGNTIDHKAEIRRAQALGKHTNARNVKNWGMLPSAIAIASEYLPELQEQPKEPTDIRILAPHALQPLNILVQE